MRKNALLTLLLLFLGATAFGQAAKNMTLVGHLPFPDDCADVVGYKHPGGIEYAIVGHESGVGIVSLATPSNPTLIHDLAGVSTIWREIDVYQNYAYIVNEGGDGLRIVNLTNLPGPVTYKDTVINGMNTGHTIFIEGTIMYVYGADIDQGGVSIFSLANPWKPTHIGAFTTRYVHDAYIRNGMAYLSEINDGFLEIADLANPNNPQSLGITSTPSNFTHNTWLNDAGNVVFTTDEVNAAYITAYDVTNPANIQEICRIRSSLSSGQAIPHNVKVLNDFIVTAYYKDGVNMVDAARPHNLIEVGYYDTNPQSGGGFDGVWGSDPYLPSGLVLASDMSEGLWVLGPTYVRACYLEGNVTDITNSNSLPGATVTIQTTTGTDFSANNGDYATGVADAGTYAVLFSKFGYRDTTLTVTLTNGQLVVRDVAMTPLNRVGMTLNVIEQGTNTPISNASVLFVETGGAITSPYTTNGNGQVIDNLFIAGSYNVIAGKWGWHDAMVTVNATQTTNTVTIVLPKGYQDDFALDLSWTTSSNANTGDWVRGEPIGTFSFGNQEFNPEDDITNDISDQCYVTGNGGGQVGDDDVDAGTVTLTTPDMDLTSYSNPVVHFYRWFANGGGSGLPNDSLLVRIDNGSQTVTVRRISGLLENNWKLDSFSVAGILPITSTMHVSFVAGDYPQGHVVEGAIDGFEVVDRSAVSIANPRIGDALLTVAPNPMKDRVMVHYSLATIDAPATFVLTDMLGKIVCSHPLPQAAGQFDLQTDLPQGVYIGSIRQAGVDVVSLKVVR
jgi:choice-of-anchor B domain-containing protein